MHTHTYTLIRTPSHLPSRPAVSLRLFSEPPALPLVSPFCLSLGLFRSCLPVFYFHGLPLCALHSVSVLLLSPHPPLPVTTLSLLPCLFLSSVCSLGLSLLSYLPASLNFSICVSHSFPSMWVYFVSSHTSTRLDNESRKCPAVFPIRT